MFGFVADLLASLALGVLREWLNRNEIRRAERYKILAETLELDRDALAWLAEARGHPGVAAQLRVREPGGAIHTFTPGPGPVASAPPHDRRL